MRFIFACLLTTLFVSCAGPTDSAMTAKVMRSLKQQNSYDIQGCVLKPGRYPAKGNLTLTEAIVKAGGFAQFADVNHVYFRRGTGWNAQRMIIDVEKIVRHKDTHEQNPVLKAGDVIVIDEKTIFF